MSRLDDLVDLIQTTNEVYFITAPGRVRTAYILIDDISELALKTYLQEQTLKRRSDCFIALQTANWITSEKHARRFQRYCEEETGLQDLLQSLGQNSPNAQSQWQTLTTPFEQLQHWSANDPNARKEFNDVVDEVKVLQTGNQQILTLLDDILERHRQRNKFFHDHHQSGLTVDDEKCLRALCDLFFLMEELFPSFHPMVQNHKVVRCQIGALRLKLAAAGSSDIINTYNQALEEFGSDHTLNRWSQNFEHSILHTVSERFFSALQTQFRDTIAELEVRIRQINNMTRTTPRQRRELADKTQRVALLKQQLDEIDTLLSIP